ncbi:MrcB family domain-containing protein [Actinophytocola sediminis]
MAGSPSWWAIPPKFTHLADTQTGELSISHYVLSLSINGHVGAKAMDINTALSGVYTYRYQHQNGKDQQAQKHLREVRLTMLALIPPGMRVLVSGSGQSLPLVPWIAVLDPDVTTTAQEGLYIVYLYRADLSRVYLSMNQGATQHKKNAEDSGLKGVKAESAALVELQEESSLIRSNLDDATLKDLLETINLGARRFLPRGYEEGNIAAIEYDPTNLPDEEVLRADLTRFLALYSDCVEIKREVLATTPGLVNTAAGSEKARRVFVPRPPAFRPRSSDEYRVHVPAQLQNKGRRHEGLLNSFFGYVNKAGLIAANNVHPCDLTVENSTNHWLVEAKTVGANAENAVREAIGQLFSYRHFCYRELKRPDPTLVALFSESIGDAFVGLLTSLGIEAVWRDGGEWQGRSPLIGPSLLAAAASGIVQSSD